MTSISARLDFHHRKREREWIGAPLFVASLEGVKTPEQILLEREQSQRLEQLIDQLKPRFGLAVRYYYGIRCEPRTLEQVGVKFGVGKERVRQILNKALRTLRYWMLKAEDRKRYIENLDRKIAERRANELRLEALRDTEYEKNAHQEWEQTEEQRALRAKQLTEMLAGQEVKQRARDKRRAKQAFDWAYVEACRLNALWELELERRADERRLQEAMALQRLKDEKRFKKTVATKEQKRLMKLEVKWKRKAQKGRKRKLKLERDWLLVESN